MPGVCGAGGSPSLRARQDLHQLSYMLCSKSIFLSALIGNDSHTAHSWLCFLSRKAFWKVSPSVSAWRPQTLLIREYQTCIFCLCFHLPRSSHWSHWSNSSIHDKTSKFCWIIDKTMVAEMPVFFFSSLYFILFKRQLWFLKKNAETTENLYISMQGIQGKAGEDQDEGAVGVCRFSFSRGFLSRAAEYTSITIVKDRH